MLERLWKKVLRRRPGSLWVLPAAAMWVCSLGYRLVYALHGHPRPPKVRSSVPVVSIGNITVGGTGKTPMVEFIARDLIKDGLRVGIVSSGYGRARPESFVEPGYTVRERSTDETGDEVHLLAGQVPEAIFSVDRSKATAARALDESKLVDLIIVDDGFQHFDLARDIDIVTYDAAIPRRMLKPFPYGLLREPLTALSRADVVIITRANFARDIGILTKRLRQLNPQARHYSAQFVIDELIGHERRLPVKYLEDKHAVLFAGVGNFKPLRRQVAALCADLDAAIELSDHQRYTRRVLERIKSAADAHDSDVLLTTGKDWVKLGAFDFGRETYYLTQSIDLDPGEEKLVAHLKERLQLAT